MATRSAKIDQKADLIWAIADKLTGVYKPHEYGDVILPLTVIRRFDCILSDTKDAVLQKYEEVKNLPMKDVKIYAENSEKQIVERFKREVKTTNLLNVMRHGFTDRNISLIQSRA